MDGLVTDMIKLVESKKKTSVPWKFDQPHNQPFHRFEDDAWKSQMTNMTLSDTDRSIRKLALFSWNVDFMLPFPDSRMRAAIAHLRSLIDGNPERASIASVVFLQECVKSDIDLIAADSWIQNNFILTDLDTSYWQSGYYGTISLIDRRLPISSCFRIHYSQTRMERDALFTDVILHKNRTIRLCNTHLESLALEPAYRPPQLRLAAEKMHSKEVDGAILAGDLNAIQDFDQHLHTDNNLKDAYLEHGGKESDAEGHTWGQQAATVLRNRFGTSRMDKVYYSGDIEAISFERFGSDVVVQDNAEQEEIRQLGFDKGWITDHLGVKAVFVGKESKAALS